jgi:hypothetical protein
LDLFFLLRGKYFNLLLPKLDKQEKGKESIQTVQSHTSSCLHEHSSAEEAFGGAGDALEGQWNTS